MEMWGIPKANHQIWRRLERFRAGKALDNRILRKKTLRSQVVTEWKHSIGLILETASSIQ